MKKLIIIATVFLLVTNSFAINKIIFGEDDRRNYYEMTKDEQQLASSVATLIGNWKLEDKGDYYKIKNYETLGERKQLCVGEKYAKEPSLSMCTGFLIAPDLLLTAGHCYVEQSYTVEENCKDLVWMFDYHKKSNQNENFKTIEKSNIYKCKEVLSYGKSLDFALVKLDRKVKGIAPLEIEYRNLELTKPDRKVFSIGHPNGIPSKVSTTQIERFYIDSFETKLDSFPGLSGAPVFDSTTKKVIGIHISGMSEPFIEDETQGCYRYNQKCNNSDNDCLNSTELNIVSIWQYIKGFLDTFRDA